MIDTYRRIEPLPVVVTDEGSFFYGSKGHAIGLWKDMYVVSLVDCEPNVKFYPKELKILSVDEALSF